MPETRSTTSPSSSQADILILEDERIIAKDIELTLERLGYAVPATVSTGQAAIDAAKRFRPDLALVDVVVPGNMDGIGAASRLSGEMDIPVVYLTAYADSEILRRAKQTDPVGYIVKPFQERELLAAIEMGLHQHTQRMKTLEQTEEQIRRDAQRAEALVRISSRLNAQLDFDSVLNTVCEEATRALDVPAATVTLYDSETDTLQHAASHGLPAEYQRRIQPMPVPDEIFTNDESVIRPVIATLDAQTLAGKANEDLYQSINIRSIASATLCRDYRLIGMLNIYTFDTPRKFSESELTLLRSFADHATQAIANARFYDDAERRLQQLDALRKIDVAITSSMDLSLTLGVFLDQVVGQQRVDAAAVLLYNDSTQTLEYAAGQGFRTSAIETSRLRLGDSPATRAVTERTTVSITDISEVTGKLERGDFFTKENFVAYHAVPLLAKGQIQGVLETFHRQVFTPDDEWLYFLEALAGQAAIAIDNVQLFNDLQHSNTRLTQSYEATIEGWARALELRDDETEGHTRRVTDVTVRLAREMDLPAETLPHIRRGALLHDIGKIGIPDSILLKPGPLNENEWGIMRQHPQYAVELLHPIAFLRPALDIPEFHHERWDGSGYPYGRKGKQIPIAARIFAVVDVWDALRSDRPYRDAWPEEKVRAHIRDNAGILFDSEIVDTFLKLLDEDEVA